MTDDLKSIRSATGGVRPDDNKLICRRRHRHVVCDIVANPWIYIDAGAGTSKHQLLLMLGLGLNSISAITIPERLSRV